MPKESSPSAHLIRQSPRYVPRRQYDQVVKDLKPIYTAAEAALEAFEEKWGDTLPVIGQAWRNSWEYITPFLAFEPDVRRVIYTTAIDQRDRSLEPPAPQSHQDQKGVPDRGRRPETHLPRDPERRAAMEEDCRLDESTTRVQIHFGERLPD